MQQELYHEIFGSILDRSEMTPYMLLNCDGYDVAISQTNRMLANRGFDLEGSDLSDGELQRAETYVKQALSFLLGWLFPTLERQFVELASLGSSASPSYVAAMDSVSKLSELLAEGPFARLVAEDPRHLFLLASSAKYPNLFKGYPEGDITVPRQWRLAACAVLKMCHLIKSVEEDSQDINGYSRFGLHLESKGIGLTDLWSLDWNDPALVPDDENARIAYVKVRAFFRKLGQSVVYDDRRRTWVFASGDGVRVDIVDLKARLKSPESMFSKLGKDSEETATSIRDILALTFIIRNREDSLTLFHALQKRGVILQENTRSTSITQTLFASPQDMREAVRELMINLARSEGLGEAEDTEPDAGEVREQAERFYAALGAHAVANPFTADRHRKIQCKIGVSVPVHFDPASGRVLIPGTEAYGRRFLERVVTSQQTLPVELRISDRASWEESEQRGEAHHEAYKFRQLATLADRLFKPLFSFGEYAFAQLREDQEKLFG